MATQAASAAPAANGGRVDPYPNFNFRIEVDGVTMGHFAECSGPCMKINVLSYREGGNNQVMHRIAGAIDHANVTLRCGLTRSTELWNWVQAIAAGKTDRRQVHIVVLEPDGHTEALRWTLEDSWPTEYTSAPMNAGGNELAIETITLVFESLSRS